MQISSNPAMINSNYKYETIRFLETKKLVEQILSKNEKLIIWTSYKFNIDFLCNKLRKFQPVFLHGSLETSKRERMINSFLKNKEIKVLIYSS